MQIITDSDNDIQFRNSVVTIGTFDGLHVGHTEIIKELKNKANELNTTSLLVTFYPHPRTIVAKDFDLKLLTPLEEKKEIFNQLDIDFVYIIPFTKEFSKKTYTEFFDEILIKTVETKHLVIGYDHKFGNDRDGDTNKLKEYTKMNDIGMTIVGPKEINDDTVSSTKIRNALMSGNISLANKMLGREYILDGIVVEGAMRGRTLGFPTANLGMREDNKLVPKNGVYFVRVKLNDSTHYGVANIGLRPTFNHAVEPITEVHILNFDKNIYGDNISIQFIDRIRDEKKFSSKDELEKQIILDVEQVKNLIKDK